MGISSNYMVTCSIVMFYPEGRVVLLSRTSSWNIGHQTTFLHGMSSSSLMVSKLTVPFVDRKLWCAEVPRIILLDHVIVVAEDPFSMGPFMKVPFDRRSRWGLIKSKSWLVVVIHSTQLNPNFLTWPSQASRSSHQSPGACASGDWKWGRPSE
jgi:hypothetical protein